MKKKRIIVIILTILTTFTAFQGYKWYTFYQDNQNVKVELIQTQKQNQILKDVLAQKETTILTVKKELLNKTVMFTKELDKQAEEVNRTLKMIEAFKNHLQKEDSFWKGETESTKELIRILENL